MRRSRLQRFFKLTILWVVLLQAVVVVVIMVALLQGNDKQDETISISSLSSIPRRLQFINGEWYANQCSGGSNLYCWARQPRGGNTDAVYTGLHDDAWSTNDDAGWSHYDDFFHNDDGHDDGQQANDDDNHGDDQVVQYQDDYHLDDQYWNDDYYQNEPDNDDDYVYSYEPVPEASIINAPNGGYGGRRGRSLSQIRFNKCPPVIPGFATTSWRYKPSEFRYGRVSITKIFVFIVMNTHNLSSSLSVFGRSGLFVWSPSSHLSLNAIRLSCPWRQGYHFETRDIR
jgi:hypothetical protein